MTVQDDTTGHDAPFSSDAGDVVTSVNGETGVVVLDAEGLGAWPLPAGGTIDTTTYDDPILGSGTIPTVVVPSDRVALAVALEGDAFPRLVISADPGDFGAVFFGDGTFDPVASGANISTIGGLSITPASGDVVNVISDLAMPAAGTGLIVRSPDNTAYRIVVANGGALSTEAVV